MTGLLFWTLGVYPTPLPCPLHPILTPSLSTSGTAAHQPCRYHQYGRNGTGRYVCSPGCGSYGPAPSLPRPGLLACGLLEHPIPPQHLTPPCLLPPPPTTAVATADPHRRAPGGVSSQTPLPPLENLHCSPFIVCACACFNAPMQGCPTQKYLLKLGLLELPANSNCTFWDFLCYFFLCITFILRKGAIKTQLLIFREN